jgi:Zn-dependent protease with chaperone function
MSETTKRKLRTFPGITPDRFQHQADIQATEALKAIPGFDKAVAKIMEYGMERIFYLDNVASNVRVTENMFGPMYRSLQWGCKILDMEEPELYVTLNPVPNAYTFGHTKPFIVMTSGLVDLLSPQERFFVIGHELGHIKAGHVLYTMMAYNIAAIMALIGQATLGIGSLLGQGLVFALLEWQRKAEFTCDRAGLLCVQDVDPCIDTFMKLAGGAASLFDQMDREEFIRQIREYEDADRSNLNKAYKFLLTVNRTHPYSIMRAKELDLWSVGDYETLMSEEPRK